ncbi:unnamed protein product [Rotaria sp. Silwood1]|nr:unnamed protein product [Rotaria sp. Silwood1]CAF1275933.1 unnamed protein product [Rotaria sp. Silwood1]CAF3494019.1 unnamed protein product [Rotaria sp. Silwood1]CAF3521669.1 unnamed protein product [Rotaria sp. Silwood1]CAF4576854.1 unnamed protein product [Rotaria sp. Silwood1]
MLYIFRVDIGETYTFDTELAFQDVKTLKSTIEHEHGIASSKQILIINGGELLDDDAVQVCMKTRETCAGTEENPIYLLDKSHLERSLPLQIPLTSNSIPILDNATVEQWLAMPSTYETIVQRADTAQNFNKYAQKLVQNCERFVRDQQAQYQGWMAVIANVEDTLSSFLLNRNSFNRLYQNYISERSSYLELFQSLPRAIKILHQLKLPNKLIALIDNVNGINYKSTVSSSASSSSISSATTTSSNYVTQNENDIQTEGDMSLFEWITAQLANVKVDDIINGCTHFIDECSEELLSSLNIEIDVLFKKISNPELKHMIGIEERFALLQNELKNAKHLQHEQKDCAEYLISQRQRFSSNVGNQRDKTLIKDISGIHSQNLIEISKRHQKLIDIEKKIRKSKQEIIDQLHRRFKSLMVLQRHLVDHDTKLSVYTHKLNRTRKTMTFLQQLNQAPNLYYSFLYECIRRKQYSNIFNQFSEIIHHETKNIHNDEISKREQFIKQYEPHFLFNLLPALKILPTFFIKEPLPLLDLNLPDITLNELDQLFEEFPEIKQQNNNENSIVDCTKNLYSLIHCTKIFHQEEYPTTIVPLSVLIPSTTTMMNEDIQKQIPSPTNSSSRSTVVRSPSSSDVESPNELLLPQKLLSHDKLKQTMDEYIIQKINENQLNIEQEDKNDQTPTEKEIVSITKLSTDNELNETLTSSTNVTTNTISNNEEEDDYVQCTLEAVYTSTEMAVSPSHRLCVSQQTDNEYLHDIRNDFISLKTQYEQTNKIQHEYLVNYHETILKIIINLQQLNYEHEQKIEQLHSEINNHIQDNETLKIQCDVNEQIKQELILKYETLENNFDEFRRTAELEKSQIVKAFQSDFEFEIDKSSNEQDKNQILTTTIDIQTDEQLKFDKQTSIIFNTEHQLTQTNQIEFIDQSIQTSTDDYDETIRRLTTKEQQIQFNLAIQRAVQNATDGQKKQINILEQQLEDKRLKIIKLKECIKKLQNFYTLSSTPPSLIPSITKSVMTTSNDDEQQLNKDEKNNNFDDINNRTTFIKRSEPISMPSTFIAQSMLAAGNAATSPKTEQPIQPTVNNLLMEACFKSSPNESSNAVELYTPFAASPPSQITNPLLAQTTVPISSVVSSSPIVSSTSRISTLTINSPPQATPIAFFTVNRSDHVIIYFDTTYQHYMIFTYLSTLHFIHSDCYELFNIQQKQNSNQQINNTNVIDSISTDNGKNLTNIPSLINTSMINSALIGNNVFNPSTTPLLGQVTDKEYCQAKKANNRFNVPLGTKFYRVRVKPWKPTISSSPN